MKINDRLLREQAGYLAEQARCALACETVALVVDGEDSGFTAVAVDRGMSPGRLTAEVVYMLLKNAQVLLDAGGERVVTIVLRAADGSEREVGSSKIIETAFGPRS